MLLSTRSPEVNHAHIGREAARIIAELVGGPGPLSASGGARARVADHAFVREKLRVPIVSLQYRSRDGLMPVVRTIWSQTFADEGSREAFYGRLLDCNDHWNVWAELAFKPGRSALTQYLRR